jgi:hypothetical protein
MKRATENGNGHSNHSRVLTVPAPQRGNTLSNAPIVFLLDNIRALNRRSVQLEIENLRRRAQVLLLPLFRPSQLQAAPSSSLPVLTPESSSVPAVLRSHGHYFWFSPRTYVRTLYLTLRIAVAQFNLALFAVFLRAVHLARLVQRREIGHLHSACHPREVLAGLIISELSGTGFSVATTTESGNSGEVSRPGLAISPLRESDISSLEQVEGLRDELRDVAARLFPEMPTSEIQVSFRGPTSFGKRVTRDFEVLFSNSSNEWRKLLLRVHVPRRTPVASARESILSSYREYEMMNLLWATFSGYSDRFYVPEPLQYFPNQSALLMENPRGDRLDQILRWNRLFGSTSSRKKVASQVHQVGEWLALFHWTTLRQEKTDAVHQRMEQDFDRELAVCRELGLSDSLAQRIQGTFESARPLLFDNSQKIVAYHSAFIPPHVYIGKGRVTAVGFGEVKSGFIYEDIADFLIAADRYVDPGQNTRFPRLLREQFLRGYQKYETLDVRLLKTCLILKMLSVMSRDREDLTNSSVPSLARLGYRNRAQLFSSWFEKHLKEEGVTA